jgi:hypothetical protein
MGEGLRQLNARHDPVEDRLLLALTLADGSEIRLWLTRRYTILLLGVLDRLATRFAEARGGSPLLRDALADMAQGRAIADADFATPFAGGNRHPLGEAPLLVAQVQCGKLEAKSGTNRVGLLPMQGDGINLDIDEKLTHVFAHLLRQAADNADWRLPAGDAATATATATDGRALLH